MRNDAAESIRLKRFGETESLPPYVESSTENRSKVTLRVSVERLRIS
jgi:hypothetical protein